ncbi:sodium- and chloride-dependent glycine transporter 2-like [Limulus polyphemus]|uniref:Transporter n=1 Tax=Limulus polyphemus TaxID=6850 RepID=A0ABM1B871_LIMPO|nr:sodium- and chloride-dependent glycine transporter 2-like [Limulus polyphemus]
MTLKSPHLSVCHDITGPTLLSVPAVPVNVDHGNKEKSIETERGQWGSKAEFILSCIGLSVGIGNVWRFPYLAYQNGGGAFLLPYFLLLIVVGKPMYFMEVALGQFSSLGPMSVWRCFPLGRGIGAAMITISLLVAIYYNVIMGYCLYYMGQSFRSDVPWSSCYEWWGADNNTCYVRNGQDRCPVAIDKLARKYKSKFNASTKFALDGLINVTLSDKKSSALLPQREYYSALQNCTNATQTASEQFWERFVLNITGGIEDIGVIKWDLAACLFVSWMIVFLCLMKGVKSSGKVVYFTATFPYLILIILLIRGLILDGAGIGLRYFLIPQWEKLKDVTVWRAAAEQLFFSLSVASGGLIMFGSYNKFYNKVYRDAMFVSSLDFLTSLIAGIVIFSVLGNMSEKLGIDIEDVVEGGIGGLISLYYATTLIHYCCYCFQGGQYILNLMDTYGGGFAITFIAICELVALMWGYGIKRFCDDLEFMLGTRPNLFWKACWFVVSPLVLINVKEVVKPDTRWGPADPEVRQQYFKKQSIGFSEPEPNTKELDNPALETGGDRF